MCICMMLQSRHVYLFYIGEVTETKRVKVTWQVNKS